MTVRVIEQPDGRDVGRAERSPSPGCALELGAALVVLGFVYVAVHAFVWLARVVVP